MGLSLRLDCHCADIPSKHSLVINQLVDWILLREPRSGNQTKLFTFRPESEFRLLQNMQDASLFLVVAIFFLNYKNIHRNPLEMKMGVFINILRKYCLYNRHCCYYFRIIKLLI